MQDTLSLNDGPYGRRIYATRADAIRAAISEAIKRAEGEAIDRSYRDGYAKMPETEEELADAYRQPIASIGEERTRLEDWL